MKFNLENYQTSKAEVIELVKSNHSWETNEGFVADGVICPEVFAEQKIKILCFLGETYGYDKSGVVDIERQLEEDVLGIANPKTKTPKKLGALIWLLTKSLENGSFIKWEDFPSLFSIEEEPEIQNALSKIAWVNVKKASKPKGSTRQNYHEIYESVKRNDIALDKQVKSICPDLIMVFSRAVFDGLSDWGFLGDNISAEKGKIQTNEEGTKIVYLSHPSYVNDWGYEPVYELARKLYDELK